MHTYTLYVVLYLLSCSASNNLYYYLLSSPIKQNSPRGDGGVGFLVRECLVNEVEFINTVKYEESVWMKIRSERGREALYIGCVYMPTDSTSISVICYG